MNKFTKCLIFLAILSSFFISSSAFAQSNLPSASDEDIDRALDEAGVLEESPELNFQENVVRPGLGDDAYQDENGNPIGKEAFEASVAKSEADYNKKQTTSLLIAGGLLVTIIAITVGVVVFIMSRKNKNSQNIGNGFQSPNSLPQQPITPQQNQMNTTPAQQNQDNPSSSNNTPNNPA